MIIECKKANVAKTDVLGQVEEQISRIKHQYPRTNCGLLIAFPPSSNSPSWCRLRYQNGGFVKDDFLLTRAERADYSGYIDQMFKEVEPFRTT